MTIMDNLFGNKKKLIQENKVLKQEVENLHKEIDSLNSKYENIRKIRANENTAASFCNWSYINYYFRDDFEEKFMEMVENLPKESKNYFKWLFLRSLAINYNRRETLFFDDELEKQKQWTDFKINNVSEDKIGKYNFKGGYNLHGFIDLNLSKEDKNFLKNKDIIDAGAFTGDTAIPLSEVTHKNVFAFEPFEESFKLLKENVGRNNISNIKPVNKSLGNINGERSLYLANDNFQGITSDSNLRKYMEELKVQEVTVDQFVKENNLDVGLITIDVEGAEKDLLSGAVETIKSQKPMLFISIYHSVEDFFEIKPWIENLDLGYKFEIIKEQPWTFIADTILKCKIDDE